jgi:glycosyltransferase involved in cell wall biosynthesis
MPRLRIDERDVDLHGRMKVFPIQKVTGIGGSERHLLELLPALASRGVEVRMCVLGAGRFGPFVEALQDRGVDTQILHAGPDVNPLLVFKIARRIRDFAPDLVHTHLIHADVHGQVAAQLARVQAISTIHSTNKFYLREPYRSAARIAGHLARRVIAISNHTARFAADLRLASEQAIRVIPYGIDASSWELTPEERMEARADLGLGPEVVAVGVASRLFPNKGHDFLLDAMGKAVREAPQLRLLVAGDGPLRCVLEELAARVVPGRVVRFLGYMQDVRRFMGACDIVVFPSLPGFGEGFGLAALEAMAAGRPVIATAVDSLVEIVVHAETGFLVTPGDVQELADVLLMLARAQGLRERLGRQARQRAMRTFPSDRMVESTLGIYHEALREGPSRFGRRDMDGG